MTRRLRERPAAAVRRLHRDDAGTGIIEFFWLGLLLLVPIVYLVLTAFQMQRATFAVTEATRSAARAYITAPDQSLADARARAAAQLTVTDHHLPWDASSLEVLQCEPLPCGPGSRVTVAIELDVQLPGLAALGVPGGQIPVRGTHHAVVDSYDDRVDG